MDGNTLRILLAVAILFASFVAFMSAKSWRIWHVAIVFFLALVSCFYWIMAGHVLAQHEKWRSKIADYEEKLLEAEQVKEALRVGTEDAQIQRKVVQRLQDLGREDVNRVSTAVERGGLLQTKRRLEQIVDLRGRVWAGGEPQAPDDEGNVTVSFEAPSPEGIEEQMTLFAFQQGPTLEDGNRRTYIGEFKATAVNVNEAEGGGTVTLTPALVLSEADRQRLGSSGPWILYERMPIDRHDIISGMLAEMNEEEFRELFPEETVEQFLRDSKPAKEDDPPERVQGYKADGTPAAEGEQVAERRYVRRLRDYGQAFREFAQQHELDQAELFTLQTDAAALKVAEQQAEQDLAARDEEIKKLTADAQGVQTELAEVKKYVQWIGGILERLIAQRDQLLQQNSELAQYLAEVQAELTRRIDERTAAAVP